MATFALRGTPLVIENTQTGLSISCLECDWVQQLAIDTPVSGAVIVAENHHLDKHPPLDAP